MVLTIGHCRQLSDKTAANDFRAHVAKVELGSVSFVCNCIGPQAGERLCPCMLRAESERGQKMITEGVIIDGVLYKLVPASPPHSEVTG